MMYIEVYKSTYTGNTSYSGPKREDEIADVLARTAACKHLTTIKVLKFDWCKQKNGFNWWPGKRKLYGSIPYAYTIPPLYSLNGKVAPRKPIRYEVARAIKVPAAVKKVVTDKQQLTAF